MIPSCSCLVAGHRHISWHGEHREATEVSELRGQLRALAQQFSRQRDDFETEPAHGRIYPAKSVKYRNGEGLVQTASSPGYWGGLWSLTCCKHDMRQENFFDQFEETKPGILRPTEPLFVFTCAGKTESDRPDWAAENRRWLTSVALVTHAFWDMGDYGEFLLEHEEDVWKPRISTQGGSGEDIEWAQEYGDCHAIVKDGEVVGEGKPGPAHDHVSQSGVTSCGCSETVNPDHGHIYQEDNDSSLLKFASTPEYWVSWSEPQYYWTGKGRARYGAGQDTLAYRKGRSDQRIVLSELQGVL